LLDAANLESLPDETPHPAGADRFTYEVTYGPVRRSFASGTIPEAVAPALAALNTLLDRHAQAAVAAP